MMWLVVLLRIVSNPFSNVFQKALTRKTADPLFIIGATHGLLSVVCLPACLVYSRSLSGEFWVNIAICAILAVAGNALIVKAVQLSDLSVLGPINAYKAVVSLIPGMILLHEIPGMGGLAGMALIVGGSYFLVDGNAAGGNRSTFLRLFSDRGVQYRLAALVLSAIEAVFLKMALRVSSPMITFVFWAVLGFGVALAAMVALKGRELRHEVDVFRASRWEYLMLFVTTGVMQLCTLVSFQVLHVGYALALFQTSSIISVILGYRYFQERHIFQRLVGSVVMVVGAALIIGSR
ncbi:MAG: EamA family transporter [Bacillota bacterium]